MTEQLLYIPGYGSGQTPEAVEQFLALAQEAGHKADYVPLERLRSYAAHGGVNYPPLESLAKGVRRYMQIHNIERASLIGHSMGGAIAMQVAAMWPESISKVAAVCPSSVYSMRARTMVLRTIVNSAVDYWNAYGWSRHPHRQSLRVFLAGARQYVGRRPWELRRAVQEVKALTTPLVLELGGQLAAKGIPTWVLYGECDKLFEPEPVREALETSTIKISCIEGGIHNLPQHQGDLLFNELCVTGFLAPTPERS